MEIINEDEKALTVQSAALQEVEATRAGEEVVAAVKVAKLFPRNQTTSYERIIESCKRSRVAERAVYAYPRGGSLVRGPSIRLAEIIAQHWGNFESGIKEIAQSDGVSTVLSYAWDLETNTRDVKTFQVRHERYSKKKGIQRLTEQRDVYELVANLGARRKRACILAVIPEDVIEGAVEQCRKTLEGSLDGPLVDKIREMVVAFKELGITQDMIEKRIMHPVDIIIVEELIALREIYRTIKDGMAGREEFFEVAPADTDKAKDLGERLKGEKDE